MVLKYFKFSQYTRPYFPKLWTEHPLARHVCARTDCPHRSRTQKFPHHANTRGSSRLPWCVKSSLSSQRHVSYVAALVTEHFYTTSLTYLTPVRPPSPSLSCPSELDQETLRDSRQTVSAVRRRVQHVRNTARIEVMS